MTQVSSSGRVPGAPKPCVAISWSGEDGLEGRGEVLGVEATTAAQEREPKHERRTGLGEGAGGGEAGRRRCGHRRARWPQPKHSRQRSGCRQVEERWSVARHRKQRPQVRLLKSRNLCCSLSSRWPPLLFRAALLVRRGGPPHWSEGASRRCKGASNRERRRDSTSCHPSSTLRRDSVGGELERAP